MPKTIMKLIEAIMGSLDDLPMDRRAFNAAVFSTAIMTTLITIEAPVIALSPLAVILVSVATPIYWFIYILSRRQNENNWLFWVFLLVTYVIILADWIYVGGYSGVTLAVAVALTGVLPIISKPKHLFFSFFTMGLLFFLLPATVYFLPDLIPVHTDTLTRTIDRVFETSVIAFGLGVISFFVVHSYRYQKKKVEVLNLDLKDLNDKLDDHNRRLEKEVEERTRDLTLTNDLLMRSEARFRDVAESTTDLIWETDEEGRFTYVSPKAKDIMGYECQEMIGKRPMDFVPEPQKKEYTQLIRDISESREPFRRIAVMIHHKDGQLVFLEISGVPFLDDQGVFKGNRGIVHDITDRIRDEKERKQLERQFQQAQKMEALGALAGGIAHDFNNILGAIIGYAQLAQLHSAEDQKIKRYTGQLCKASERAKGLVQQILTFSRQSKTEKIHVDISEVVKETLKLIRASIPSTIEIKHNISSNLGTVKADQTQIHQVVMNLCMNAFHAMKKAGGELNVVLSQAKTSAENCQNYQDVRPGKYAKLTISDTGHGMDEDTVTRIFEPYFTTKEKGEGTGLGLATVHGIVKNHGGGIKVSSEPGVGTSFHILLPVAEISAETTAEQSDVLPKGNEQILFVDDEKILIDVGKELLESIGYKVETRISAYDALEAFQAKPDKYDLIITDMTMPKMTGEKLAKRIKKIRPNIPILMCTGFSTMVALGDMEEMGIHSILMKPLTINDLANTVRRILDENQNNS
jgi:PAS domain S-box-containing protein